MGQISSRYRYERENNILSEAFMNARVVAVLVSEQTDFRIDIHDRRTSSLSDKLADFGVDIHAHPREVVLCFFESVMDRKRAWALDA